MQTSDYLKKTGEELQSYLEFKRRGFKVKPKKGKGSFKRKEKYKEKFDDWTFWAWDFRNQFT